MQYNFLTYGRLSKEFSDFVQETYPELHCIHANSIEEAHAHLPEVNAVAGFNFLQNETISHLRWIHSFTAGVDSLLTNPALNKETIITRSTGDMGAQIGEFCLAYMLAEAKALFEIHENQKSKIWKQTSTVCLGDLNVLVLGTGSIGQGIAKKLGGLVNKVYGLNRSKSSNPLFDEIHDWNSFQQLENIHVVINALPSTPETSGIVGVDFFQQFKDLIFINTGRGKTTQEKELIKSIDASYIKKAILDVFSVEPLPASSELWGNEHVIVSPHQSGITTITDIISSFKHAYHAIRSSEKNELFVDIQKGY